MVIQYFKLQIEEFMAVDIMLVENVVLKYVTLNLNGRIWGFGGNGNG